MGLLEPTKGKVLYKGKDVFSLCKHDRKLFRKDVQPIFQNPFESFNPLRKVESYLTETALNYGLARSKEEAHNIADEALNLVGLSLEKIRGYPHEFSGGELQRTAIARALLTKPRLLIADEPVSMIDASLRMNLLDLFLELKKNFDMSIIYVTHDLATAYYLSDYIAIMYRGNLVEYGSTDEVLKNPLHPYTEVLIECVPEPDPKKRWKGHIKLSGLEVKEFEAIGCRFVNRCPNRMDLCLTKKPPEINIKGRTVRCWLYGEP